MSLEFLLINLSGLFLNLSILGGSVVIARKVGWKASALLFVGCLLWGVRWIPHIILGELNVSALNMETHRTLITVCGKIAFAGPWLFLGGIVYLTFRGKLQHKSLPSPP